MLGKEVKCTVTGFKGIAVAKIEYLNGCIQYQVKPKVSKSDTMPEGIYLDVEQLEVIGNGIKRVSTPSGGPSRKESEIKRH